MDFTADVIIWICAVAVVAGFTQGLTGFGFAVLCTPLLLMMVPVKTSVPVAGLCGGAVAVPLVLTLRRHVLWKPLLTLLVSSIPGVWLGAKLLKAAPVGLITGTMGVILAAVGVFQLSGGRAPEAWRGRLLGVISGFLAGAVGASTAAPGPPIIAYTSLQPWDVRETKAVMNLFFVIQTLAVIPLYHANGLLTRDVGAACAWASPFVVAGVAGGMFLSHLLRDRIHFMRRIIYTAVLLLGVSMIAKAVWS